MWSQTLFTKGILLTELGTEAAFPQLTEIKPRQQASPLDLYSPPSWLAFLFLSVSSFPLSCLWCCQCWSLSMLSLSPAVANVKCSVTHSENTWPRLATGGRWEGESGRGEGEGRGGRGEPSVKRDVSELIWVLLFLPVACSPAIMPRQPMLCLHFSPGPVWRLCTCKAWRSFSRWI